MEVLGATELSSNWKKIQANLNTTKSSTINNSKRNGQLKNKTKRSKRDKKKISSAQSKRLASIESRNANWRPGSVQREAEDFTTKQLSSNSSKACNTSKSSDARRDGLHVSHPNYAGKYIAMDCEMVGTGSPPTKSQLARVSIVSYDGHALYDAYVRPVLPVTDYRTHVSGIRPCHLGPSGSAVPLRDAQEQVVKLLKGRILVGHALKNDLHALLLTHPGYDIRDTAQWAPFQELVKSKTPGLKRLAREVLGLDIQSGEHDSVEDARIAMELYKRVRKGWEGLMAGRAARRKKSREKAPP